MTVFALLRDAGHLATNGHGPDWHGACPNCGGDLVAPVIGTADDPHVTCSSGCDEETIRRALVPQDDPIAAAGRLRRRVAGGGKAPTVDLAGPQLRQVAQTVSGLARANDPPELFVRGGRLVRFRVDEDARPLLEELTRDRLQVECSRRVTFERVVSVKGGGIDVKFPAAPPALLGQVLELGEWEGIPSLIGVVESPVLREDGTVAAQPGYDPRSRLILHIDPRLAMPPVSEHPTAADLTAARELLVDDLLGDFPFVSDADRANAVGFLLTVLVRPTLPTAPLAIVTSPTRGNGKGLLVDVVSILATGRRADVYSLPGDDDELRKALLPKLQRGGLIFLDEVGDSGELRSRALAAVLTAEHYSDRKLGVSEEVFVRNLATFVAAGNNVTVAGDIDRRSYPVHLDARVSRPWLRDGFRHADLYATATERRGDYLHAALTIASGWHAAGRPRADGYTVGGFTAWATTIGGMLAHAGIDGFLGNLAEHYDQAAEESNAWEALLLAAAHGFDDRAFLTAELATYIEHDATLAELLPDGLAAALGTRGFVQRLGKALRARVETRHGSSGARLVAAPRDAKRKTARWRVVTDEIATSAGSAGTTPRPETTMNTGDPGNGRGVAGSATPFAGARARASSGTGPQNPRHSPHSPPTVHEGKTA